MAHNVPALSLPPLVSLPLHLNGTQQRLTPHIHPRSLRVPAAPPLAPLAVAVSIASPSRASLLPCPPSSQRGQMALGNLWKQRSKLTLTKNINDMIKSYCLKIRTPIT